MRFKIKLSRAKNNHPPSFDKNSACPLSLTSWKIEWGFWRMLAFDWDEFCHFRQRAQKRTHRMRRGKLVPIPEKWQGKTTYKQTINKRNPVKRRTRKK